MKVELSDEQRALVDRVETTQDHLFITGRAGTGKSTLLRHLVRHSGKAIAVAAPTGVAALNVGGQTLHSLFNLPLGVIANAPIRGNERSRTVLQKLDTLIIDEISMVNADVLDAVDRVLRQARKTYSQAFGGVQVVMFGDPYQLAPVPPRGDELRYFEATYPSMWFFDAKVWQETPLEVVELTQVHRQPEMEFKDALNAVRHGQVTAEIAELLNSFGARPVPEGEEVLTLASRNDTVRRINDQQLAALPGKAKVAVAEVNGEFGEASYPADEVLQLKLGAQVMFLRNDPHGRWVNGTIGRVTGIGTTVFVEVDREEHEVEPVVWEKHRYTYDEAKKELTREVSAEFTQFPLRLAWAVTIHKAQGATLERAVIDLGARAFSPGQTYVALSRLTSIEGLHLTRPLTPRDIIFDVRVREFMTEVARRRAAGLPGWGGG